MKSPPRILLVGGGGYLGINIVAKLQQDPDYSENYEICVLDFQLQKFPAVKLDYQKITFYEGSFLNEQILDEALKNTEIVFHIAAVGVMGVSGGDREQIHRVNVEGTRALLEKCRQFNVRRFVLASSIVVTFCGEACYDAAEDTPIPAEDQLMNYYSVSKAKAETMVRAASCDSFKTCALRFRAIYGPGDPNATRRVVNMIKSGFFVFMCKKQEAQAVSQASSINNCSNAFLLADKMLKKENGPHGKAYHILDEEIVGSYDFWGPLVDALGFERPTRFISYNFLLLFAYVYQAICYNFLKISPILTTTELKLLAFDNTYSLKEAKKDLGYVPEKGMMDKVVEYYKHERVTKHPYKNYFFSFLSGVLVTIFSVLYITI